MKFQLRSLLALAGGLLAHEAQAQAIPNGNLNTWAQRGPANAPTNWLTTDDLAAGFGIPFATGAVTRSTDFRSSPFAARLANTALPVLGTVPGVLVLGTNVDNDGLPFTGRPARMEFYYKLSGTAAALLNDSAAAYVELTRTTAAGRQTLAEGFVVLRTAATTYTLATARLTYTNSAMLPDTIHIGFQSSKFEPGIATNTVLLIDDVAVAGTGTATRDAALSAALIVAPNPSPDGRYYLTASPGAAPGLLAAPLAVLDATGRVVRREAAPATALVGSRTLDLGGLPEGIYTLQLFTDKGLVTRKLVR